MRSSLKVDAGFFWRKLLFQASFFLLDPKGVDPDLEESDLVDSPMVWGPTKPWTGDEGALRAIKAPPLCVRHRRRQPAVEAQTDTCLKAALLVLRRSQSAER